MIKQEAWFLCVCMCVCGYEKERERATAGVKSTLTVYPLSGCGKSQFKNRGGKTFSDLAGLAWTGGSRSVY